MREEEQMDEDLYWDLLEEQHAHDVVISGPAVSKERKGTRRSEDAAGED